ncbi:AUGMIN subunit 2-like [Rutidosis leptorrhynchoides]|uniref:AUGMIN subunit 2-like n=1 Tax=Rutidosis leptorrhynchoides TaxID=125765 RepID=UPI003A9A22DE
MASIEGNTGSCRKLGGISDVLAIASDLGYSRFRPRPSQEDLQNGDELVKVLHELIVVQRKVANLHVELRGRKEDMKVAHLTHVSEMEKKIEMLARIISILKGFIQNKDRIIARLQQPFPLEFIPVEAEYQKEFSELLMHAASDYGTLAASVSDLHWTHNFKEPPSIWAEMLRPISVALVSCTRYFEAMSAMRESFTNLQKARLIPSQSLSKDPSRRTSPSGSECMTPHSLGHVSSSDDLDPPSPKIGDEKQEGEDETNFEVEN